MRLCTRTSYGLERMPCLHVCLLPILSLIQIILLPVSEGLELSERGVAVWQWEDSHEALSGNGRTAMKRRKWKPGQKALIVLEGLKGRPIGELCAEHEISQAPCYQWRDQSLANLTSRVHEGSPAG
jgi:Transposase